MSTWVFLRGIENRKIKACKLKKCNILIAACFPKKRDRSFKKCVLLLIITIYEITF